MPGRRTSTRVDHMHMRCRKHLGILRDLAAGTAGRPLKIWISGSWISNLDFLEVSMDGEAREEPTFLLAREELRPDERRSEAETKGREWWRTLEDDDLISLE